MKQKERIEIDFEHDYVKALFKAFHQFLIEDFTGKAFSETRLKAKIEGIRLLYHEEAEAMRKPQYFGSCTEENVELIFMNKEGFQARLMTD